MKNPDEFCKLLEQIISKDPEPTMSPEEIHFDQLVMGVMELVGNRHVVW
jgi:hypothetical protein